MHLAKNRFRGNNVKRQVALVAGILLVIAFAVAPAMAQNTTGVFTAHITGIQLTTTALSFDFTTDNTPSSCNGYVFYNASGSDEAQQLANVKAALAGLMAAELSGHAASIGAFTPTSTFPYCTVQSLWVCAGSNPC